MTRRFSPNELSFLRNRIPVDRVIENLLELPTRRNHDKLSFACPVCGGFDTSINTSDNLARCFACRKNFNPIELVMHHLHVGFVDSVKWLKSRIPATSVQNKASDNNPQPASVGDILADMIPTLAHVKSDTPSEQSISERLSALEDSVRHLYHVIDELRSSLDQ